MRRTLSFCLVAALAVAVPAGAEPGYFESTLITDAQDDFAANGALDIVALHAAEKYSLDHGHTLQVRVEVRNFQDIERFFGEASVEYTLGYKLNDRDVSHSVLVSQSCVALDTERGPHCKTPTVPGPHFATASGGVTFVLPVHEHGLHAGSTLTNLYAASATVSGDGEGRVYQDVAPQDNANQPHGTELAPVEREGTYTIMGVYPFLALETTSPSERFIVPGGTASYSLRVALNERQEGFDRVVLLFDAPPGWTVEANLGSDIVVREAGESVAFDVNVRAPALAQPGEVAAVAVDAVLLQAGGHDRVELVARVSGDRVLSPEFAFALVEPGTLRQGDAQALQVRLTHLGEPATGFQLKADFVREDARVATVPGAEGEDGVYTFPYAFPSGGPWTMEVYVSELAPSPYASFDLDVQGAEGAAPGAGVGLLVGALAALAIVRRRVA